MSLIHEKEKEEKEGESIFDEQTTCGNLSNISFENVNSSKISEDVNALNESSYHNTSNNNYNNTINKMFLKGLITKNNQINELWTKKLKDSGRCRNGSNM